MKVYKKIKYVSRKIKAAALIIFLSGALVFAQSVTVPWPSAFQTGEVITAARINAQFNDINNRFEELKASLVNQVAAFPVSCPNGWEVYTAANGRTIMGTFTTNEATEGTAFDALNFQRIITEVPEHFHKVDPPSTDTSNFNIWRVQAGFLSPHWGHDYNSERADSAKSGHKHSVNIPEFNSGKTGNAAGVDVTMPYIQMTFCKYTGNYTAP